MAKTERTYLDTSDGMAAYAKRYGAEYDRELGQWYVNGEVPHELMGLIPKQPRRPVYKSAPLCPICRSHTVERSRKRDGNTFWGCSQFSKTGCKGLIDYDDYLDTLADTEKTRRATDFFISAQPDKAPVSSGSNKAPISPEFQSEVERVLALATKELGGNYAAKKWLSTPKFNLKGQTPLDVRGATVPSMQPVPAAPTQQTTPANGTGTSTGK